MNVRFELKTVITFLTTLTLCFFLVPTSFAKKGGGGKPPPEPPPPVAPTCIDYSSAFPAFAYIKINTSRKGSTKFYLSNAAGDCTVLIHTANIGAFTTDFAYRQNGVDGVLVWKQPYDENAGRKDATKYFDRIKMIKFQVGNKEVTSLFPLSVYEVASSTATNNGFDKIDLSPDASKIAVSYGNSDTPPLHSIREIDISVCVTDCPMIDLYSHEESLFNGLSYSTFGDRIYFTSKFNDDSSSPLAGQSYVGFIEKESSVWNVPPRILTISNNGSYSGNLAISDFRRTTVSIADFGDGATEIIAFDIDNREGFFITQVIDVGDCIVGGSGDCISTEESRIVKDIFDGYNANFDNGSNATSVLLSTSAGIIKRHNLSSGHEDNLVSGDQADAAN